MTVSESDKDFIDTLLHAGETLEAQKVATLLCRQALEDER